MRIFSAALLAALAPLAAPRRGRCGEGGGLLGRRRRAGSSTPSSGGRARGSAPRNLLLITIDTLRADRVGCYGYPRARTPRLDRLAAEGARFETAIAPVPLTLSSHTSILTGRYPAAHGVHSNGRERLPPEVPLTGVSDDLRLEAYVETRLPAQQYGWSALRGRDWKYVSAPEPELYDLAADPGEPSALAALAGLLREQGRGDEARRLLEEKAR